MRVWWDVTVTSHLKVTVCCSPLKNAFSFSLHSSHGHPCLVLSRNEDPIENSMVNPSPCPLTPQAQYLLTTLCYHLFMTQQYLENNNSQYTHSVHQLPCGGMVSHVGTLPFTAKAEDDTQFLSGETTLLQWLKYLNKEPFLLKYIFSWWILGESFHKHLCTNGKSTEGTCLTACHLGLVTFGYRGQGAESGRILWKITSYLKYLHQFVNCNIITVLTDSISVLIPLVITEYCSSWPERDGVVLLALNRSGIMPSR